MGQDLLSKIKNKNLTISLIIPAYNEQEYIGTCLEYALRNSKGYIDEIIVIDNASTDNTKKIAEKYPGVRVVTENNKGLTFARQRGYKESKCDILAFIDADTRMPEGWAKMIKNYFKSQNDIGFVSGPYHYYDLNRYQIVNWLYWRILAYPTYLMFGYLGVGGNFAIRKNILDKISGFDTKILFYGEDTDIARRASKYGKSKFSLKLVMYTSARRFTGQGMIKTGYIYILNFISQAIFHKSVFKKYENFR